MITQVINVNEILEQALLFDFYGELLTEHQKEIYEQFVLEDLSLGEIAREAGISRQGVHDLVKRCNRQLEEYEAKLHLVEKFLEIQGQVRKIRQEMIWAERTGQMPGLQEIIQISDEILEEL